MINFCAKLNMRDFGKQVKMSKSAIQHAIEKGTVIAQEEYIGKRKYLFIDSENEINKIYLKRHGYFEDSFEYSK